MKQWITIMLWISTAAPLRADTGLMVQSGFHRHEFRRLKWVGTDQRVWVLERIEKMVVAGQVGRLVTINMHPAGSGATWEVRELRRMGEFANTFAWDRVLNITVPNRAFAPAAQRCATNWLYQAGTIRGFQPGFGAGSYSMNNVHISTIVGGNGVLYNRTGFPVQWRWLKAKSPILPVYEYITLEDGETRTLEPNITDSETGIRGLIVHRVY